MESKTFPPNKAVMPHNYSENGEINKNGNISIFKLSQAV